MPDTLLTHTPAVILPDLYYLPTPNQSDRGGQKITGIVIHETEGSGPGAASWLRNPRAQASAHGVLFEDGATFVQLVPWGRKAWHATNANGYTLGLELAGFTSQPNSLDQMARAARITAFWCQTFGIPARQADQLGRGGICRHRDLGAYGGGHHDPGGFDWGLFLKRVAAEVKRGGFRPRWGTY